MTWVQEATVADVLAFEAWPEEMQEIAKRALAPDEEAIVRRVDEACDDIEETDQALHDLVYTHIGDVSKLLTEAIERAAAATSEQRTAILSTAMLRAVGRLHRIPPRLDDVNRALR